VLETWYYYRTIIFAKFRGESLFFWFLFKLNCPLNRKSGHLSGVIGERGGTGICSGKGNAGNLSSSVEYLPLKALKMSSGILISKKPILYNCIIRHFREFLLVAKRKGAEVCLQVLAIFLLQSHSGLNI
jgi:hypothetical protein